MNRICILTASKGRPLLYEKMVKSAIDKAVYQNKYICMIDDDEERKAEYYLFTDADYYCEKRRSTAFTYMTLAEIARQGGADYVLLAGDDIVFETQGWDEMLLESKPDKPCFVMGTNDGKNTNSFHAFISMEFLAQIGHIPNIFHHYYIDPWFEFIAKDAGCYSENSRVVLRHNHYKYTKEKPDELYKKNAGRSEEDRAAFHSPWAYGYREFLAEKVRRANESKL